MSNEQQLKWPLDPVTQKILQRYITEILTDASTTVKGVVELATTAETTTGTDATKAVTPDGLHDMTSLAGTAWMLDEDNMASDSATKVPSQQSVKAYIATQIATADYQAFTGSGTWTKPSGVSANSLAIVFAWGAGGGGA